MLNEVERAKNTIRAFVFNILDFDNARVRTDKKIQSIKDLLDENVILKPDKGEGVVIVSRVDYETSMQKLFSDRKRFRIIKEDLTPTRLSSVQRYLQNLQKRGEIDEATYQSVRPQSAKPARAYGLPKIHKPFDDIPVRLVQRITELANTSVSYYILLRLMNTLSRTRLTLRLELKPLINPVSNKDTNTFHSTLNHYSPMFLLKKPSKSSKGESMMKTNYQQY